MRARAVLLCFGLGLSGCRGCDSQPSAEAKETGAPTGAGCAPRMGEHLGIPFVKVCPEDLATADATFEPFWIAAQQLGCSAGEHDTLRCPHVTALQHPALGEERRPSPARGALAAVLDANVAQTTCYMRFGGRLPTRQERARAEAAMGLASVMVAESPGTPRHFDFIRLAEWVTETPCTTQHARQCKSALFPEGPRAAVPWARLLECDGTPLLPDAGAPLLDIGESCPAPDFTWRSGVGRLPCAVRSPAARTPVVGFTLSCRASDPAARHPDDDVEKTAAFRCVLPGTAFLPGPS